MVLGDIGRIHQRRFSSAYSVHNRHLKDSTGRVWQAAGYAWTTEDINPQRLPYRSVTEIPYLLQPVGPAGVPQQVDAQGETSCGHNLG